ncbi:BQ5605_C019g08940 [Microbotryum silenes-dioicae]|uniref:BQ5605_C019g08940 protein n=1 Tax=Microbotryum silenes-dioicae TaxID=796604 RepID=A0A2X0LW83_9BASI|nr:BQ5605_C019g08940 [Microbotryum silenes-dioicae]
MARTGRQPRSAPDASQGDTATGGGGGGGGSSSTKSSKSKTKSKPMSKKRQTKVLSQADGTSTSTGLNVYSFEPGKKKARGDVDPLARANVGKGKGRRRDDDDDEDEEGMDAQDRDDLEAMFNGDEPVDFTGFKPKGLKMGLDSDEEQDGDEEGGDDDEDINSDDAGTESEIEIDETPPTKGKKGTSASKSKPLEINLDEDQDDSQADSDDDAAYYDATHMLDMGLYDSDASDEDSENNDEDEDMSSVDSDDNDSEYEGAIDKLDAFVQGLEAGKKRKNDDLEGGEPDASGKKKKRVVLKEKAEAYPEGEFVAVGAKDGANDGKIQLDDLLASFAESKNPKLVALRKTLKATASTGATSSNSHLKAPGPLAAPLPARLQDKIDREAAFDKTKEETDKWNETVRRMKGVSGLGVEGARHERLTLPLMAPTGDAQRDANSNEWAANFEPSNQLEASIQSLLAAGQMTGSDLKKAEQQALKTLDPEDLVKRQTELRTQRDLMFRAERKAKRVAKIKSKAFRRIHRKALAKGGKEGLDGLSLDELKELDLLDGGSRAEDEQARREVLRAKERMTLKHSSKGGRWSRTNIGGLEGLDEERNTAVREMVARKEALTRRIEGRGDDDRDESSDDDDSDDSEDENDTEGGVDKIRRRAFDELASLEAREKDKAENGPQLKGVLNMKFMRDAIAREDRKVQQSTDELRTRLERMEEMGGALRDDDEDDSDDEEPGAQSQQVQGNTGRMVFGPSGLAQPTPSTSSTKSSTHTTKLSAPLSVASVRPSPLASTSASGPSTSESNPWLALAAEGASGSKISRKPNKAAFGKDEHAATKLASKVERRKSRLEDAREAEKDDARVEIDGVGRAPEASTDKKVQKKGQAKGKQAGIELSTEASARLTMEDEEVDSSDEEGDVDAQRGKGKTAIQQRELVAKAFAGDDVVADFEEEKRREIERDAPKEIDNTLPGWVSYSSELLMSDPRSSADLLLPFTQGAWSGKGVKKSKKPQRKFITHVPGIKAADRQDAKFSNVIISEKKDKKASKYLLKDLPFPYTSVAQHEHKLRTPMGPEWSTSTVLRDQTLPSVLIKPGVTIRPVERKI